MYTFFKKEKNLKTTNKTETKLNETNRIDSKQNNTLVSELKIRLKTINALTTYYIIMVGPILQDDEKKYHNE